MTIANGYRARWRDAEYEASPDGQYAVRLYTQLPTPGFAEIREGRHCRVIPRDEADWGGYVRTVAGWRDLPVLVLAERDAQALVEYLGGLAPLALAAGLTRIEPAVYQGWVEMSDLTQVQQVRTP